VSLWTSINPIDIDSTTIKWNQKQILRSHSQAAAAIIRS
jgi:hypothetical protein